MCRVHAEHVAIEAGQPLPPPPPSSPEPTRSTSTSGHPHQRVHTRLTHSHRPLCRGPSTGTRGASIERVRRCPPAKTVARARRRRHIAALSPQPSGGRRAAALSPQPSGGKRAAAHSPQPSGGRRAAALEEPQSRRRGSRPRRPPCPPLRRVEPRRRRVARPPLPLPLSLLSALVSDRVDAQALPRFSLAVPRLLHLRCERRGGRRRRWGGGGSPAGE